MDSNLIISFLIGGILGLLYGVLFFREKKRALLKYLEAAKNQESLSNFKQATFFSLEALLRYGVVLGSLVFLIYKNVIQLFPSILSFLVLFWGALFIMTRRNHET